MIVGEVIDILDLVPNVSYSNPFEDCKTHHFFYTTGALVLFFAVVCFYLFIHIWLHWVSVGSAGSSLWWLQLLQSTGSWARGLQ